MLPSVAAASSDYPTKVEADNPLGYWRLGEASGATFADSSGNSHPLTLTPPTSIISPYPGTFDVWLDPSASGVTQAVVGKPLATAKSENYGIWLTSANKVQFKVGNGSTSKTLSSLSALGGGWHQVVATFSDSGLMSLYVDGSLSASGTASFTSALTNSSTLDVGRESSGAADFYGGGLDELAIYPTVLSPSQILDQYATAEIGPTGGSQQVTRNFSYDANGQELTAGGDSFGWDVPGEITQATVGGTTTSYGYDGSGSRLSAAAAGATTNFVWDTNNSLPRLAEETDGAGQPAADLRERGRRADLADDAVRRFLLQPGCVRLGRRRDRQQRCNRMGLPVSGLRR